MLSLFKVFMSDEAVAEATKTMKSGFVSQGPRVEEFEEKLSEYIGNPYILSLNSGTAGLTLALRLLRKPSPVKEDHWPGYKDGDEVLSPSLTCFATNAPVLANNLKLKWVDVDPKTSNIDLEDLKSKITVKTKVIMFVHWGGYPVDLDKVAEIQEYAYQKYGFRPFVIEDGAHAFGSEYKGEKIGSVKRNNLVMFSFQAIKHLSCCDGGAICCPNQWLYERGKLLRWFGIDRCRKNYGSKDARLENDIEDWGYKFHMNDLNATIGIENLKYVPDLLRKCQENSKYYFRELQGIKGLTLLENREDVKSSNWLFTMRIERKPEFMNYMSEKGIMVSQVHNRNDLHECTKEFRCPLPNLDVFQDELICIPVGWWVTEDDRERVVKEIKTFYS